jgi:hypothetical protein
MVVTLFSWRTGGLGDIPLCDRFSRLCVLAENPIVLGGRDAPIRVGWGRRGVEVEMKVLFEEASGDEGYLHGRRTFLGTIVFCFITLFCRMVFTTVGNGYLTQSTVSQSTVFITCLQCQSKILCRLTHLMFGSNTFHLKYLYLHGPYSTTVFQQRIISSWALSFKQKQVPS